MSFDIDMQSYAGAIRDPAAVDQVVESNSYLQDGEEYPVQPQFLDTPAPVVVVPEAVSEPVITPQAENFRALREEVDRMKSERETERKEHQFQIDMMRVNLNQQSPRPEPQARKMFDGMAGDDVPNVEEIRNAWAEKEADYKERLEELHMQQMNPDYAEVINKYLVPLVKQKPHLAEGIKGATNKAAFAYDLAKMAQAAYQMPAPPQPQEAAIATQKIENAQRIVDNARKPGTLSQAGGQSVLSKADYFATMSDQEFMRMATKNLEAI